MTFPTRKNWSLNKMVIGISISDSDDLAMHHVSSLHVDSMFTRITQHLLAEGATVAYGGNPTLTRSFSMLLADMATAYTRIEEKARDRIVNYIALPVAIQIKPQKRKTLEEVMTLRDCFTTSDRKLKNVAELNRNKPEDRPVLADWYTQMRTTMQQDLDARIILGGKLKGYSGLCPGVAEEATLAAEHGAALYLLGGYGGCARALAEATNGSYPEVLTEDWQRAQDPVLAQVDQKKRMPYFERLEASFGRQRQSLANNGLTSEQNVELKYTRDQDRIIQLLVQGLREINLPRLAS